MKKIIPLIIFLFSFQSGQSQTVIITRSKVSTNNDNDNLHQIANGFSEAVGAQLKKSYPARIGRLSVKLKTVADGLKLSYEAEIISCSKKEALYYFEHRGALSARTSKTAAELDAKKRAQRQEAEIISCFKEAYGEAIIVSRNTARTEYGYYFWAISESFIASGKGLDKKKK